MIKVMTAAEKREELQMNEKIGDTVNMMFTKVANDINTMQYSHTETLITGDDLRGYTYINKSIEKVIEMIKSLGYRASFYYYSNSWTRRSGKWGYFSIDIEA